MVVAPAKPKPGGDTGQGGNMLRKKECKSCMVKIGNPGDPSSKAHSCGFDTHHGAMVDFWMYSITPNAPMTVWITLGGEVVCNKHLIKKRLTLRDVPKVYRKDVAKTIADDIYSWLEFDIDD